MAMIFEPKLDRKWHFWIDRGGTFTDIVARQPNGQIRIHKLLSENPNHYADAPLQGIRDLMGIASDQPIPAEQIAVVKMGTTVATNALLERKGDRTLLLITKGFRDALRIGYQNRPNLFALQIQRPDLLYEKVIEVEERYSAQGQELLPLQKPEELLSTLQATLESGIQACAIVFLHGYRYPHHEQQVAQLAQQAGFTQISVSHQVSPLIKLVSRGDTTTVDAYLSPILRRYVDRITTEFRIPNSEFSSPEFRILFMQSNGGLTPAQFFQGKDSILSGPAGGIVGAVQTSLQAGFQKIITFDMGGTSTDVAHYDGVYERVLETEVAGVRLRAPMLAIHTVAAGGGSIVFFDGMRYRVGPDSAGANPGPACYRNGGPLTVTDCNVMVGKIQPQFFPQVFGPAGNLPIDPTIVQTQFTNLAQQIQAATGDRRTPEQVAEGFLAIAIDNMANAIKKISVQRGYDLKDYVLCCFGAAGGQHTCRIAEILGIQEIFIHPYAGVLSAYGMGLADRRVLKEQSLEIPFTVDRLPDLELQLNKLTDLAMQDLQQQGDEDLTQVKIFRRLHLRYDGTDATLEVPFSDFSTAIAQFETTHQQRYGFLTKNKALIVGVVVVEAVEESSGFLQRRCYANGVRGSGLGVGSWELKSGELGFRFPDADFVFPMFTGDAWCQASVFMRDRLSCGDTIVGPALIMETTGTNVIEPNWQAIVTETGNLILRHITAHKNDNRLHQHATSPQEQPQTLLANSPQTPNSEPQTPNSLLPNSNPVLLEIFNNLFMAIAEQMGVTLQNTSSSVNIKERLDFSCALFDRHGHLVANAPHIPVHLGSMSESIQALIQDPTCTLHPGDVYLSNNPYNGGTHLPDITVITPVFGIRNSEFGVRSCELNTLKTSHSSELRLSKKSVLSTPSVSERETPNPEPRTPFAQRLHRRNPELPLFFVASRGHHADIGGITPGSMPPYSTHLQEEGVLLNNFKLVDQGIFQEEALRQQLTSGSYPVRNLDQNIADLQAQIAANAKGVQEIQRMIDRYGLTTVQNYMQFIQDNAEAAVRQAIAQLATTFTTSTFTCPLDNGMQIQVTIDLDPKTRSARLDFTGTSPQQPNNFNAPVAVCKAAVLYVFRTLVSDPIPLNAGCLKPLEIIIPSGSLLNPTYPAAVVAGNVETSQAIADALYGALGILAASQGTMNNFTFGNDRYQYYETICGGSGAGAGFSGTDAVQTHMTNSRLTDPEVLELRFPVLLEDFRIRDRSGGIGQYRGGHGVIRRIQFQETLTASILSNRRQVVPYGLAGGQPGLGGHNRVERSNGEIEMLASIASVEMRPGDVFVIETPGGGGYGVPAQSHPGLG
jgi:5-oxoprolinase (ATP-hydrolysing)